MLYRQVPPPAAPCPSVVVERGNKIGNGTTRHEYDTVCSRVARMGEGVDDVLNARRDIIERAKRKVRAYALRGWSGEVGGGQAGGQACS